MLRPYQSKAIQDIRKKFHEDFHRVILMLSTGAGKTVIAVEIIKIILRQKKRCAFIVDRIPLIDQTLERLDSEGINCGVMQGMHDRYNPDAAVQLCSIQTLARRDLQDMDFIIVDEAHTVYQAQIRLFAKFNAIRFLGITATPFTKGLGNHWETMVTGPSTQDLIDDKYLVPFVAYGPSKPDLTNVRMLGNDYHQGDLAKASDKPQLIADIITTWLKRGENRPTLCFATNIAHSKHIVDEFNAFGVPAAHIDTYTPREQRKLLIDAFEKGMIKILSSVDVLGKGFDSPIASCLIQARATKSLIVHIQQIGRVLRIHPNKTNSIILDHAGNHERLGFATDELPKSLDKGERKESKNKTKKEKLPKACPQCHFLKDPGVHQCPKCGHIPERLNTIATADGELVKVKAKVSMAEKQKWYAMFLYHARAKNYADGWAAWKFKERFGNWPIWKSVSPIVPNEMVERYIQHLIIKNAFSRKKATAKCRYCHSTNLQVFKGNQGVGLWCNDCGRHLQEKKSA